jgi:hypothetical protein
MYADDWESFDPSTVLDRLSTICLRSPQSLFPLTRYSAGFAALREDRTQPLLFAAIAGIPPELVSPGRLALVDFANEGARGQFYQELREHPDMQAELLPAGDRGVADDVIRASCDGLHGVAKPPTRLAEVAELFGEHGLLQSICAPDFGSTIDTLAARISAAFDDECLEQPLRRDARGLVDCELTWSLPPPSSRRSETPTGCSDERFPFLLPTGQDSAPPAFDGGERCRVAQLAVETRDGEPVSISTTHDGQSFEQGWFYDDFSSEVARSCARRPRRIALSAGVTLPRDVSPRLDCRPRAFASTVPSPCDDDV